MKHLLPNMFCTGDDDGVIKVRHPSCERHPPIYTYLLSFGTRDNHKKYVVIPIILISFPTFCGSATKNSSSPQGSCSALSTSFAYFCSILLIYSADGTLSVIDVRTKKSEPLARSEDQEDELLSIVAIKKSVSSLSVGPVDFPPAHIAGQRWSSVLNWESYRYSTAIKDGATVSTEFQGRSRKIHSTFLISTCTDTHNPLTHSVLYHPHIPPRTLLFLQDRQMVFYALFSYFLPSSWVSLPITGHSPSKGSQSTKMVKEDG